MHLVPAGGFVPGLRPVEGYSGGVIWGAAVVVGVRILPRLVRVLYPDGADHNEAHEQGTAE